jgi:hypothetical protein
MKLSIHQAHRLLFKPNRAKKSCENAAQTLARIDETEGQARDEIRMHGRPKMLK